MSDYIHLSMAAVPDLSLGRLLALDWAVGVAVESSAGEARALRSAPALLPAPVL